MTVDQLRKQLSHLNGQAVVSFEDTAHQVLTLQRVELGPHGNVVLRLSSSASSGTPLAPPASPGAAPKVQQPAATGCTETTFARISQQQVNQTDLRRAKPVYVKTPDGVVHPTPQWRDVAVRVLEYLFCRHTLAVPNAGRTRGSTYFLNHEPKHRNGKPFKEKREFDAPGGTVYIDVKRSSGDLVHCLTRIIEDVHEVPGQYLLGFVPNARAPHKR